MVKYIFLNSKKTSKWPLVVSETSVASEVESIRAGRRTRSTRPMGLASAVAKAMAHTAGRAAHSFSNFILGKAQLGLLAALLLTKTCYSNDIDITRLCRRSTQFNEITKSATAIKFIELGDKSFLIKQILLKPAANLRKTIAEAHAAAIAKEIGIATNDVHIIPCGVECKHKPETRFAATIHSMETGKKLCKFLAYKRVKIHQLARQKDKKTYVYGLTYDVIHSMAKHADLAIIAAFDTFIGNVDRHRGNLMFQEKGSFFIALDHSEAFNYNLCKISLENMRTFFKRPHRLSSREWWSLGLYRDTLKKLVNTYSVSKLKAQFDHFLSVSGYLGNSLFNAEEVTILNNAIMRYKNVIRESHDYALKFIHFLDDILRKRLPTKK